MRRVEPSAETRLTAEVRPRSDRDTIEVLGSGKVRVRVTAPPADGAANEAVRDLLARTLDRPRATVEIERGAAARTKIVRITGLSLDDVMSRLRRR